MIIGYRLRHLSPLRPSLATTKKMKIRYKIDSLRASLKFKNTKWKTHPNMEMLTTSNGRIRVLDTKIGKESLLIIPDSPNVIEHYFDIIEQLGKSYRVIIFDLYGFGFSYHNGKYDYSFDSTNLLINEILDLLKVTRTNVIFPCSHGFYGISFATSNPDKVNQLILLQTPSLYEMNNWSDRIVPSFLKRPILSQLIMPLVEKKFVGKWYDYSLPKETDREPYQSVALKALNNGATYCLCSLTQGFATQNDSKFKLDDTLPMTLIYGNKDFTHKKTDFNSIKKYNSNIDIIQFEDCGHFPHLENKKRFIQIVKDKIKL